VRVIFVTEDLEQRMEAARHGLLGEQVDDEVLMFTNSFGHEAVQFMAYTAAQWRGLQEWNQKLNVLVAATLVLEENESWLYDHESGWQGEPALEQLAALWRQTLRQSSAALGLEEQYGRPGVLALVEQFAAKVRSGNDDDLFDEPVVFRYQP
jgi:hypothetical protein